MIKAWAKFSKNKKESKVRPNQESNKTYVNINYLNWKHKEVWIWYIRCVGQFQKAYKYTVKYRKKRNSKSIWSNNEEFPKLMSDIEGKTQDVQTNPKYICLCIAYSTVKHSKKEKLMKIEEIKYFTFWGLRVWIILPFCLATMQARHL